MNERFNNNALFEVVSPEELRELDLKVVECLYQPGDIVFEEGDPGEHLYLVAEGIVTISKRGRGGRQETLTTEHEGGYFGEMSILDGEKRSARATAETTALLGRLHGDELDRYLAHSSKTARHFARMNTRQLRDANARFIRDLVSSERLSLLGTMMSAMVHDFRNPISTIGMVAHYLENQDQDSQLMELGGLTQEAIDSMQEMIQELLDFSKGTTKLDLKEHRIDDLVAKLDRTMLLKLKHAGIEVRREIDYHGPIRADGARLIRLLTNVIKNSWEAMPHGGTLTLRVFPVNDAVRFEVEDTGCGISPDILNRIFEPFVTHGKTSGTGLGMSIAKSVVEAHKGKIWLDSEEGRGTCCHVELPLKVTPPRQSTRPIPGSHAIAGAV